ncbi:MAG: transglutaminase-like domain-containing protein [Thermodesulfobacteriota bacterium]
MRGAEVGIARHRSLGGWPSKAVLVWWIAMVGALVWREFVSPQNVLPLLDSVAVEIQERKEWMGIYSGKDKIGYASTQITREGESFLIAERATMRLNLMGIPREIKAFTDVKTDKTFGLQSFEMRLVSGPVRFDVKGEIRGSAMHLEMDSAGKVRKSEIALSEPPWLAQNLRYLLLQRRLDTGSRFQVPMFDPMTFTNKPMEIRVDGKETQTVDGKVIPAYRLVYTWNGLQSRAWVTEAGETLREEGWGGFTLVRESQEEALAKGWPSGKGVDLMSATAIPVDRTLLSPRELSHLRVRFSEGDVGRFAFFDERQKSLGAEIEVTKEDLSRATTYVLPHPGTREFQETLSPTSLVQSDDPDVRQTAFRILKGESDALRAVGLIKDWVHEAIEKVPTVSVPSAVEVLRTRQGDCNEHAVLFAALARAAGIPTKLCAGILYQEGKFYYHAWNEVYLGSWFSLDPLLGQFPADATHLKFVEGELERQVQLVGLIGRLKAEIVSYR